MNKVLNFTPSNKGTAEFKTATDHSFYTASVGGTNTNTVVKVHTFWTGNKEYTCHANIVVYLPDGTTIRGHGKAGGSGYDKESTAIENAFSLMGYRFSKSFGGVGERAMKEALLSVAKFHYPTKRLFWLGSRLFSITNKGIVSCGN